MAWAMEPDPIPPSGQRVKSVPSQTVNQEIKKSRPPLALPEKKPRPPMSLPPTHLQPIEPLKKTPPLSAQSLQDFASEIGPHQASLKDGDKDTIKNNPLKDQYKTPSSSSPETASPTNQSPRETKSTHEGDTQEDERLEIRNEIIPSHHSEEKLSKRNETLAKPGPLLDEQKDIEETTLLTLGSGTLAPPLPPLIPAWCTDPFLADSSPVPHNQVEEPLQEPKDNVIDLQPLPALKLQSLIEAFPESLQNQLVSLNDAHFGPGFFDELPEGILPKLTYLKDYLWSGKISREQLASILIGGGVMGLGTSYFSGVLFNGVLRYLDRYPETWPYLTNEEAVFGVAVAFTLLEACPRLSEAGKTFFSTLASRTAHLGSVILNETLSFLPSLVTSFALVTFILDLYKEADQSVIPQEDQQIMFWGSVFLFLDSKGSNMKTLREFWEGAKHKAATSSYRLMRYVSDKFHASFPETLDDRIQAWGQQKFHEFKLRVPDFTDAQIHDLYEKIFKTKKMLKEKFPTLSDKELEAAQTLLALLYPLTSKTGTSPRDLLELLDEEKNRIEVSETSRLIDPTSKNHVFQQRDKAATPLVSPEPSLGTPLVSPEPSLGNTVVPPTQHLIQVSDSDSDEGSETPANFVAGPPNQTLFPPIPPRNRHLQVSESDSSVSDSESTEGLPAAISIPPTESHQMGEDDTLSGGMPHVKNHTWTDTMIDGLNYGVLLGGTPARALVVYFIIKSITDVIFDGSSYAFYLPFVSAFTKKVTAGALSTVGFGVKTIFEYMAMKHFSHDFVKPDEPHSHTGAFPARIGAKIISGLWGVVFASALCLVAIQACDVLIGNDWLTYAPEFGWAQYFMIGSIICLLIPEGMEKATATADSLDKKIVSGAVDIHHQYTRRVWFDEEPTREYKEARLIRYAEEGHEAYKQVPSPLLRKLIRMSQGDPFAPAPQSNRLEAKKVELKKIE